MEILFQGRFEKGDARQNGQQIGTQDAWEADKENSGQQ
jgi:hypothetical protein